MPIHLRYMYWQSVMLVRSKGNGSYNACRLLCGYATMARSSLGLESSARDVFGHLSHLREQMKLILESFREPVVPVTDAIHLRRCVLDAT